MASRSNQDYLKAIYNFDERGLHARTLNIASRIGISPHSVMEMLKRGRTIGIHAQMKGS